MSGNRRYTYWCFVAIWIASNLVFWPWFLRPEHVESVWFFAVFAAAYAYEVSFLPSMYLFYIGRMRRPRPISPPADLRVALITLCVPKAENIQVIVRQLEALVAVRYPHDSWVLDEGNDPAVRAAAQLLGVRYFTRRGLVRYNQPNPPFKARTKAGNVNAWLDAHGHDYDFFVQLDIDHRPQPHYLEQVLGYFRDPRVAWVQAPSVYGNLENWVARGAAEQELVLQGPLQRGFYGASETPFIIGSHCTYRMRAVLEIGGFQPTRAEDHLDTVILASRGYRGVFVDQILAVGEGPDTFDTYLRQQFAWAYSMIQIMLQYTPRLIRHYQPAQAVQFLFAQTWYACWSTSMLILFATPMLVLLSGERPASAPLLKFALMSTPVTLTCIALWLWTRVWHAPPGLQVSWRGIVLHIARWPIICWALLNVVLRVKHPYMVTPKGDLDAVPHFSLRSQAIYIALAWLSAGSVWWYATRGNLNDTQGYTLFTILGILLMTLVVATNIALDFLNVRRMGFAWLGIARLRAGPLIMLVATLSVAAITIGLEGEQAVQAATWMADAPRVATGSQHGREVLRAAARTGLTEETNGPPILPAPSEETSVSEGPRAGISDWVDVRTVPEVVRPSRSIPPLDLPVGRLSVGAYDPLLNYEHLALDIEHWYVRQDEPGLLAGALTRTRRRRTPLVTIEPFPSRSLRAPVLDFVVSGQQDESLRRLARVVQAASPQIVLVRWGHEMELSGLYPWAANRPDLYRAAFRRVVFIFREEDASNARWVWSPAGNPGLEAYYPGDDVVDYVGVTTLGDEGWDAGFGLPPQSFAELLRPRYERVAGFGKPLLAAELGVSGTDERKAEWIRAAAHSLAEFPLLRAVIYFNDLNAATPFSSQPNWRLGSEVFGEFIEGALARHTAPS